MAVNERMREMWNSEEQATSWPRRERVTTVVTPPLLEMLALQPGERVLEIGSGGGLVAIEAGRIVGEGGAVLGFDLSAPLVKLATERATAAGATNVRFVAGDAQVDAIPGGPYDVATSQFGVMFFSDSTAAFANIRRSLKPGARLRFAGWLPAEKNAWYPGRVLAPYQPPPPPSPDGNPPPGPFSLGDPAYVKEILDAAGFANVRCEERSFEAVVPEDSMFDSIRVEILKLDPERAAQAQRDVDALAASLRTSDGQSRLQLAPLFVQAVNPA
jgi:SAM-dependent methyltransferase